MSCNYQSSRGRLYYNAFVLREYNLYECKRGDETGEKRDARFDNTRLLVILYYKYIDGIVLHLIVAVLCLLYERNNIVIIPLIEISDFYSPHNAIDHFWYT